MCREGVNETMVFAIKTEQTDNRIVVLRKMPGGGSARELKKEVNPLSNVLTEILALRPVTWRWKHEKAGGEKQYGFIAQEVEEIFPDMVSDGVWLDGKTHKFVTPTDLVPYLVGAIKEQQAQIDELKQIVAKKES